MESETFVSRRVLSLARVDRIGEILQRSLIVGATSGRCGVSAAMDKTQFARGKLVMKRARVGTVSANLMVLLALLILPAMAHGQTATTGTVVGTVADLTGAVVPHAKVELKDLTTLAVRNAET